MVQGSLHNVSNPEDYPRFLMEQQFDSGEGGDEQNSEVWFGLVRSGWPRPALVTASDQMKAQSCFQVVLQAEQVTAFACVQTNDSVLTTDIQHMCLPPAVNASTRDGLCGKKPQRDTAGPGGTPV